MNPGKNVTAPYLLFGFYEENGLPACITHARGADARERFYFPYLMQEIVNLRTSKGKVSSDPEIAQLASLLTRLEATKLYDLNSQLFSVIDLLEEKISGSHLKALEFIGIEPSALNRSVTPLLHEGNKLIQFSSWQEAPPPSRGSVCRSRWPAALFSSTRQYADWVLSFDASQSSLWLSVDGKEDTFEFLGLPHLLVSYPEFHAAAAEQGQSIHFSSLRPLDFYGTRLIEAHFCTVKTDKDLSGLDLPPSAPSILQNVAKEIWASALSYSAVRTNRLDSFYFSTALGDVALG